MNQETKPEKILVAEWMGWDLHFNGIVWSFRKRKDDGWVFFADWNPEDNNLATLREWEEIMENMTKLERVKFTRMIVGAHNQEGDFDNNEWGLRFWLLFTRPSLMWSILIQMIKEG